MSVDDLRTIVAEPWDDWGLIDSGHGRKWERYGPVTVVRPEPQAMWAPSGDEWTPDATFVPGSDEEGGGPRPRDWPRKTSRWPRGALPRRAFAIRQALLPQATRPQREPGSRFAGNGGERQGDPTRQAFISSPNGRRAEMPLGV